MKPITGRKTGKPDRRGAGKAIGADRRAVERRVSDKLEARLSALERARAKRSPIDHETQSIGMGPMVFDVKRARELGWSEDSIRNTYARLVEVMKRSGPKGRSKAP